MIFTMFFAMGMVLLVVAFEVGKVNPRKPVMYNIQSTLLAFTICILAVALMVLGFLSLGFKL